MPMCQWRDDGGVLVSRRFALLYFRKGSQKDWGEEPERVTKGLGRDTGRQRVVIDNRAKTSVPKRL